MIPVSDTYASPFALAEPLWIADSDVSIVIDLAKYELWLLCRCYLVWSLMHKSGSKSVNWYTQVVESSFMGLFLLLV